MYSVEFCLHTQHCHYYNFFLKSCKKKEKMKIMFESTKKKKKSWMFFYTHMRTHTVKADSEQRFLSSLVFSATLQTASWKVFCHLTKLNVTQCWIIWTLLVSSWPPVASQTCKIFTLFACKYMYIIVFFVCLFLRFLSHFSFTSDFSMYSDSVAFFFFFFNW